MKKTFFLVVLALAGSAHAYEAKLKKGELAADLETLLEKARVETGAEFKTGDFLLIEEKVLATSKFTMYTQTNSMVPVAQTAIRTWTDLKTGELILGEMHLDETAKKQEALLHAKFAKAKFSQAALKSKKLSLSISRLATDVVARHDTDFKVLGMKSKDQWENGDLVRVVEVRGRRGVHRVVVSLLRNTLVRSDYSEFPQSELVNLQANIFPIYEEVEATGQKLPYEVKELKYIETQIREGGDTPLAGLGNRKYTDTTYSLLLAETALGQRLGLWSENAIRAQVDSLVAQFPFKENSFKNGLLLQGKYATINIHPAAKEAFKGVTFPLNPTTHHMLAWSETADGVEAKPMSGLTGKAINSQDELLNRVPFRLADHDATKYINAGFDEVQVYYAVTALMDTLTQMGFSDPVLSEKAFDAFLYDPDIGMRDNAYYTDNTINFTTYNPEHPNLARDNPTIWHELGHGVMDRLMGPNLIFADTKSSYGGLSEGMADFVAKIVVESETNSVDFPGKEDFRIMNETGFYVTNELHDDGESYGGVMGDMLAKTIQNEGSTGLAAFADLTMETMRLTRNHPALTPAGWFEHMLYADELGSSFRAPGKFADVIVKALADRNFSFAKGFKPAKMTLMNGATELTNISVGSREKPIVPCAEDGIAAYDLKLSLTAGDTNFIKFPATVKVEYQKGALQGAIKWVGEEVNPQVYTINAEGEELTLPIRASMDCESINQPDGSCKDYAYVQIYNGGTKPIAKKRFYLKIKKDSCTKQ